jgi:hypothetical protein
MSDPKEIELSVCHEDDGDMNLELYIDRDNQISLSINKDGSIAWAASSYGSRDHQRTETGNMGKILYQLIAQTNPE